VRKVEYTNCYREKIVSNVYEKDDFVWIVDFDTPWQEYEYGPVVTRLQIADQEWWMSNPHNPVYYDLKNPETGKMVSATGSGNFHYSDIFETQDEAIVELLQFVNGDIAFYESGVEMSPEDSLMYEKFKKISAHYTSIKEKNV
jgi:hypothetical protein